MRILSTEMRQLRLNWCKVNLIILIQIFSTLSSTGLLGNDLSDIMATLCLIHWLRYLIMFWYSTHLISTSCSEKKDCQQKKYFSAVSLGLGGVTVQCHQLTLGLIPSTPSGTLGKASYSVETYVMTDFSSGDWTSTSDKGSKKNKKGHKCNTWQWTVLRGIIPQASLQMIYSTKVLKGFRVLSKSNQTWHDVYHPHPLGPGVWPPPAVQLHKTRAPNLIDWSAPTHGSCQPCLACHREKERWVRQEQQGMPTKPKKLFCKPPPPQFSPCYSTCICEWWR